MCDEQYKINITLSVGVQENIITLNSLQVMAVLCFK